MPRSYGAGRRGDPLLIRREQRRNRARINPQICAEVTSEAIQPTRVRVVAGRASPRAPATVKNVRPATSSDRNQATLDESRRCGNSRRASRATPPRSVWIE